MKLVADARHHGVAGADRELVMVGHRSELGGGLDQHLGEVSRAARLGAPCVGAREQQQVTDQPSHPPGRAQGGLGRLGLLAAELLGQQLEVGEHAGQRRAQLMRCVGDEFALAVEHRQRVAARRVERAEHALERSGQLGDLVLGLGMGDLQAGVLGAFDLPRRVGQLDDRPHRAR